MITIIKDLIDCKLSKHYRYSRHYIVDISNHYYFITILLD